MQSSLRSELEKCGKVLYKTKGNSMLPLLRPYQDPVIICKSQKPLKPGDVALYQTDDGKLVLHRVMEVRDGSYTMRGDNCSSLERGVRQDQILGTLTDVVRDGELISVEDRRYRAYSKIMGTALPRRVRVMAGKLVKWDRGTDPASH